MSVLMSEILAGIAQRDREADGTLRAMSQKYGVTAEELVTLARARAQLLSSAQDCERMAADARKEEQIGVRA